MWSTMYARIIPTFITVFGMLILVKAQFDMSSCPEGWVRYERQCYMFESSKPRIFEEADSICWSMGASLLSINTAQEHEFIRRWLDTNDILFRSTWLTSGVYTHGSLVWQSDNTANIVTDLWNSPPVNDILFTRVAYTYDAQQHKYGWSLVASSHPTGYICEVPLSETRVMHIARRQFGYGMGFVDKDKLPRGPHMVTEPVGVVVFGNTNTPVHMQCDASALPKAEYSWYRGNESTNAPQLITTESDARYTFSGGSVTIDDPTENSDGGYYQCRAGNTFGQIRSTFAQIIFGYLHAFPPVKPEDQTGIAYMGTRISCFTPAYSPAVWYSWFKFYGANTIFDGHPYHFVSQSGYLYFSEVQPTDDRKYYCVVTIYAPDYMVADTEFPPSRVSLGCTLRIRPGKTDSNYGPIIHTHTFPSPALRGGFVRMECIAFGSLPLNYRWEREGGIPFPKGTKITNRNRVLTIPQADLDAEGRYICTVARTRVTRKAIITLLLETKPYFANGIGDMLVDPGQDIEWRCRAVARPHATYTWYKNGQILQNVPGKIEVRGTTLFIKSATAETDEGMYQCSATNQHGTTFSTGQLAILSFPPNFLLNPLPPYIMAADGGQVTIQCKPEGAPLPEVSWLKDGANMNLLAGVTGGRVMMTAQNTLVITPLQFSDQGMYVCKASNINGEAQSSTYVRIVQGVVIDQPPQSRTVLLNRTDFLFCAASYNMKEVDLTFEWEFNGYPIDFHRNLHYIKGNQMGLSGIYIRDAQYSHAGTYTCIATTPIHIDRKSAEVAVNGPPGPPAGVYVELSSVNSSSARIVWTVGIGIDHGGPIIGYDVEVQTNYDPVTWLPLATDIQELVANDDAVANNHREDQRSIRVANLKPNTGYMFRVRAINEFGRGQEASEPSAIAQTPSTEPVRPPSKVGGGGGKVGTLTITWTPLPPSDQCGPGIGYKVYWKMKTERKREDWERVILSGNRGKHTALVGLDNYYLEYEVKVGAFNDIGDGPNSTVVVIYSAQGMPVAVPEITDIAGINISAVIVYFTPLKDDRATIKGKIRGYTVQYYYNDQGCNPMTGCDPTNLKQRNVWGQASEMLLIDLEMNIEYFFRIQVLNYAGKGPKGEWRRGETATYAPLTPPRFVRVTSIDDHTVKVRWQGIMTTVNEEIITNYKVKVWKVHDDIRNANETVTDRLTTEVIVHGLQTSTVYQLRVQGMSAGGDGQMSESIYFTLKGGRMEIDPATTQICYEMLQCTASSLMLNTLIIMFSLTCYYILTIK